METIKRFPLGKRVEIITLWARGAEFTGYPHLNFDYGRHPHFARWGFYVWIGQHFLYMSLGERMPQDPAVLAEECGIKLEGKV